MVWFDIPFEAEHSTSHFVGGRGYAEEEALQFKFLQVFFFQSVKYYKIRTLFHIFFTYSRVIMY